jgi:hypothetical protein
MDIFIEYLPTIIAAGGIYAIYKIIMAVKRTIIRVGAIATSLALMGQTADYQNVNTNNLLTTTQTFFTENSLVQNTSETILSTIDKITE